MVNRNTIGGNQVEGLMIVLSCSVRHTGSPGYRVILNHLSFFFVFSRSSRCSLIFGKGFSDYQTLIFQARLQESPRSRAIVTLLQRLLAGTYLNLGAMKYHLCSLNIYMWCGGTIEYNLVSLNYTNYLLFKSKVVIKEHLHVLSSVVSTDYRRSSASRGCRCQGVVETIA